MLARANKLNKTANVEFIESHITDMAAVASGTADCLISNCVLNLVPEEEKQRAFSETFRLLKPGGRLALSDILLRGEPLPEALKMSLELYAGCIAGASRVDHYDMFLRRAGLSAGICVPRLSQEACLGPEGRRADQVGF